MPASVSLKHLLENLTARPEEFARRYPHPWVIWEPGAWLPSGASRELMRTDPNLKLSDLARPGKAVAFPLVLADDQEELSLGRSESCDLCINDSTLSRLHLVFRPVEGGWTVEDAGSSNGCALDERELAANTPSLLHDGARLRPGQVRLTFHLPEGMYARLTGPF